MAEIWLNMTVKAVQLAMIVVEFHRMDRQLNFRPGCSRDVADLTIQRLSHVMWPYVTPRAPVSLSRHILFRVTVDAIATEEFVRLDWRLTVRDRPVAVAAGTHLLSLMDARDNPLVRGVDIVFRDSRPHTVMTREAAGLRLIRSTGIRHHSHVRCSGIVRCTVSSVARSTPETAVERHRAVFVHQQVLQC